MKKEKDPNRLGFKSYYGTGTMGMMEALTSSLMSSFFMMYLTDYSGLGAWAASLGSALLVFARVFDAVNDPFEAWIMDRAKPGKHGKYKPFVFLSIILQFIGVACLFFIPSFESKVAVGIWVIAFYLIYDVGYSFYSPEVIYRSMTLDDTKRAKLMIPPRILTMFMGMLVATVISVVAKVNIHFNDYHTAFGVTVLVYLVIAALFAVSGTCAIKEKYITEREKEDVVKISDAFDVLKRNKAVRVRIVAGIFGGLIWNLLFATANYYCKWGFCADLATGAVDTEKYGIFTLITSMMMFIPLIIGTAIAMPMMKKLGSAVRFCRLNLLVEAIACGALSVFHFTGILKITPVPFFACMALCAVALGADFVPGGALTMESMDYEVYTNGRDRAATINVLGRLLTKAQAALSTAGVGIILTAVGYIVDSATDTFIGDLAALPKMMDWFIAIMGVLPCILAFIAWAIYKAYPITNEIREDMKKALGKE